MLLKKRKKGTYYRILAKQFGVRKTQIGEICKRKREICEALEKNASPDTKRLKTNQTFEEVNRLTHEWYIDAVRRRVEVTGTDAIRLR